MKYGLKRITDTGIKSFFPKKQILWKDVIYIKTDSMFVWSDKKYKTTFYTLYISNLSSVVFSFHLEYYNIYTKSH